MWSHTDFKRWAHQKGLSIGKYKTCGRGSVSCIHLWLCAFCLHFPPRHPVLPPLHSTWRKCSICHWKTRSFCQIGNTSGLSVRELSVFEVALNFDSRCKSHLKCRTPDWLIKSLEPRVQLTDANTLNPGILRNFLNCHVFKFRYLF